MLRAACLLLLPLGFAFPGEAHAQTTSSCHLNQNNPPVCSAGDTAFEIVHRPKSADCPDGMREWSCPKLDAPAEIDCYNVAGGVTCEA